MKNGKKLTAAMTASTVVAAMAAPAAFASVQLNDINGSYAKDAIQALVDKGIINGKGDGNFDPTGLISRQDFAIILAKAAGLDVSSAPATATFSDVPTTSYAFKYVEAAHKAGLLAGNGDGTFGATAQLSRQDMATFFARALKQSTGTDYAGKGASLKFTDSASIADYAKDAVGLAVELGYISGNPDGSFNPKGNAERQAVASVAYRFLAAVDKIKAGQTQFAITTDATTVAVGQKVHFKVDGATSVAWSVSGNGVIDQNGDFVANASGAVTVTALVNGSTTITKTVNVYGVASSVTISDIKPVVANMASSQDVTITVVDANGNAVTNFNGTVDVSATQVNSSDIVLLEDADGNVQPTFKVTNGVATVTVVSNTEFAGQTTTLSVDNVTDKVTGKDLIDTADYAAVTKDITTVEQVATAVKIDAPTYVAANSTTPATVKAYVVDQDGETMLSGNYGLQYTISGVGTWDADGDSAQDTDEYDAAWMADDSTNTAASIDVNSVMGKTGNITITVASEGLTTGTATIKSVIGQDAEKLTVTNDDDTNTDNSFTQGGSETFVLTALDGNGVPVPDSGFDATTGDYYAYITDANGNAVSDLTVNDADASEGVQLLDANIVVKAADDAAPHAGTYHLVVKDSTKALAATEVATIIVNADAPAKLDLETSTDFVAANNSTVTVTAQVTDQFGNELKRAGVPVTLSATNGGEGKGAFNGKTKVDTPQVTVDTDANGLATATFAMDGYADDEWTFDASSTQDDNDLVTFTLLNSNPTTTVKYYTTASLSASLTNDQQATGIHAGDTLSFSLLAKDANGRDITSDENDQVKVTISNPAAIYDSSDADTIGWDSNNSITGTISEVTALLNGAHAHAAGNVTLTVTDLSVPNAKSVSVAAKVSASDFHSFGLFDANGKLISPDNLLTVEANKEAVVYLKALDQYGNVTVTTSAQDVTIDGLGGQFRKVSGGAGSDTISVGNGVSSVKLYYVNPTADSYDLEAPVAP